MKYLPIALTLLGSIAIATAQEANLDLTLKSKFISKNIQIKDKALTSTLKINEQEFHAGSFDFSLRLADLKTNAKPTGVKSGQYPDVNSQAGFSGETDTLKVKGAKIFTTDTVNPSTISGENILQLLPSVRHFQRKEDNGSVVHGLRFQTFNDASPLRGITVTLYHQAFEEFPVIRKWIEVSNQSAQWRLLDNLTTQLNHKNPPTLTQTPLTPGGRGAGPSIIAFGSEDGKTGYICGSEVPSALRLIDGNGSCSYKPTLFEWVLGPSETFTSEPVFNYAYAGENIKFGDQTSSALDRCIETSFQKFLHDKLKIGTADHSKTAPLWATWSNFGPKIDDQIVREMADIASRCGFKAISLDDGWQKGRLGTEPDPVKFPDFDATCKYVKGTGLTLGLWLSTYRDSNSKDLKALPDAFSQPRIKREHGFAGSFSSKWRDFYSRDLTYLSDRYGAHYFKMDFTNVKLGDFATSHESRSQKESLLRSLRGFLQTQSEQRRINPGCITQVTHELYWGTPGVPCDLAVLKHAELYHIPPNDYGGLGRGGNKKRFKEYTDKMNPEKIKAELLASCFNARQRIYAHRGLPLQSIEYYGATTVSHKGSLTAAIQDRQVCSWLLGAPRVFSGDLQGLEEKNIVHYKKRFDLISRLQKDYQIYNHFQFSGAPAPTDTDWHWWGKLNRNSEGVIVVLRGNAGIDSREIYVPWVEKEAQYEVAFHFTGAKTIKLSGKELQEGKLKLNLEKLGQEIIELKKIQ